MLYVIPIKDQFEQYCNYLALKELGVFGSEDLTTEKLEKWIVSNYVSEITFDDETDEVVERLLNF